MQQVTSVFYLPRSDERRKLWMSYLVPTNSTLLLLTKEQLTTMVVCEKHFERRHFDAHGRRLQSSYPTLFSEAEIARGEPLPTTGDESNLTDQHNYCKGCIEDDVSDSERDTDSDSKLVILKPDVVADRDCHEHAYCQTATTDKTVSLLETVAVQKHKDILQDITYESMGEPSTSTQQAKGKEARKKELKKNKRQRQMVRAAVLKMKDPVQILEELQKIDEMEYNVLQPSPLNEKVLKEKRKKLKETFDRVLKMYDKDEPEKWVELKRQELDYEKKRAHLISYYESVKHAQSVQVDDIPLPTLQVPDNLIYGNVPSQIPLPIDPSAVKPILKKDSAYKEKPLGVEPPGVPPGPPPVFKILLAEVARSDVTHKEKKMLRFSDMADEGPPGESAPMPQLAPSTQQEDMDGEEMDTDRPGSPDAKKAAAPKPTSLQQRMLALSGQNIDEFMKEMEEVHRKRERERAADLDARLNALKRAGGRDSDSDSDTEGPPAHPAPPPHPMQMPSDALEPPGAEVRLPPPLLPPGLRPPPLRVPLGPPPLRMPPGPPPHRLVAPPGPPPGLPRMLRPPGPPPGAPPRLLRPLVPPPPPRAIAPVSVLTAAPQLIQKKDGVQGATISAKPQIRNLSADVTRFVPSALRVKREDKKNKPVKSTLQRPADVPKQAPTKDDAYMQFMREMEGLL